MRSRKVAPLANALSQSRESIETTKTKVRWTIDVDPYDFS
jgi:primosomal protein N'